MSNKDTAEATAKKATKSAKKKAKEDLAALKGELIHHVIRVISQDSSGTGGSWRVEEIEEYLAKFTLNGWYLKNTHYLEKLPEGYVMLWVLTKPQWD